MRSIYGRIAILLSNGLACRLIAAGSNVRQQSMHGCTDASSTPENVEQSCSHLPKDFKRKARSLIQAKRAWTKFSSGTQKISSESDVQRDAGDEYSGEEDAEQMLKGAFESSEKPLCTGCGWRSMECWATCKKKRGYCSACASAQGTKGACCMKGNHRDPPECKKAVKFSHSGYHECVLVEGEKECYIRGANYWPLDMPGGGGRTHTDLAECQARCAKTPGCAHFSWWNDGGCHLQDGNAQLNANQPAATSGPRSCDMSLWTSREAVTSKFAAGCCRYDAPRKSTYRGELSTKECRDLCDGDSACIAADLAGKDEKLPGSGRAACYTFTGEGVNFRTECDTASQSDVCYWKKPVEYKTMRFMRHIQVLAKMHEVDCDWSGGKYACVPTWTTGRISYLPGKSIEECVADCANKDDCFGANINQEHTCLQLFHSLHNDTELKDATGSYDGGKGWYFQKD